MKIGKINNQCFRKTLTLLIFLFLIHLSAFSQLTVKQLEKIYRNNKVGEFEQILFNLHNETINEWSSISSNDTLKKINDLFNAILPDRQENESKEYFFLQANTPRIVVDAREVIMTKTYVASSKYENLKPIKYNYNLIRVILEFIGPSPYDSSIVKEYINDKENLKKPKIKKVKKLISNYNDKTKFIGQYLILPATWGKLDRSLVPYEVNFIEFNTDLTKAEIKYDHTWRGGTVFFKFNRGEWKKEKSGIEWVD